MEMDPALAGLSRVLQEKESGYKRGNLLQENETCDSGDLRPVKIDSCWIINNSYLLLVSLSDKSVLKTSQRLGRTTFNEAEMCGNH